MKQTLPVHPQLSIKRQVPALGLNCVLAIVPIRVKSKKSNKTLEAYAFMDPSSSASFCTEALAKQLNVRGRKANLMVSTINSKRRVKSYILTGLEVSESEQFH